MGTATCHRRNNNAKNEATVVIKKKSTRCSEKVTQSCGNIFRIYFIFDARSNAALHLVPDLHVGIFQIVHRYPWTYKYLTEYLLLTASEEATTPSSPHKYAVETGDSYPLFPGPVEHLTT